MSRQQGVIHVQAVSDELRLCRVRRTRAGVEVSDAVQIRAARQVDDVSVLSDESAVRALIDTVRQRRWTGLDAYCLLGGASVACQYYEIPPLKGAALRQAVELKLGQQLHFSVADALVAIEPPVAAADKSTGQVLVGATAVVSELARTAVKTLRDAGLNPIGLTAVPAALTALAHATHGGEGGYSGIFFIDERHSTFILFKNGLPVVSTDITFGAGDLTTALMRPIIAGDDVVQLDAAQALALRNQVGIPTAAQKIDSINVTGERLLPLLEPVLQRLAKQLTQWLTFAGAKSTSSSVLLRVVGPGGAIPGLAETLTDRIGIKTTRVNWLDGLATAGPGVDEDMLTALSAVVGAARHRALLPDLLPPEARNRLRRERFRRAVALNSPIVAASIAIFGLLFARVGVQIQPALADHERRLTDMQSILQTAARTEALRTSNAHLDNQLSEFDRYSPLWVGVFKEISNLLPAELQTTQFNVRHVNGQARMTVTGEVYRAERSPGFDKIVEQTLLLLDHSPFCSQVRLVSANRAEGDNRQGLAGTLSVEAILAHPRPIERRRP